MCLSAISHHGPGPVTVHSPGHVCYRKLCKPQTYYNIHKNTRSQKRVEVQSDKHMNLHCRPELSVLILGVRHSSAFP